MIQRCHNPKNDKYQHYGGRGITVCDEWRRSPATFYQWALTNGYAADLEIDRRDNKGNYEPGNCRWATRAVQTRNSRRNIVIEYQGRSQVLMDWARELRVNYYTLLRRVRSGKPVEQILSRTVNATYHGEHTSTLHLN